MRFEAPDGSIHDIDIAPEAPIADLRVALVGDGEIFVEGVRSDLAGSVGALWEGSQLGTGGSTSSPPAAIEVVGVAGVDAGACWRLAPGGYELPGRSGPWVFVDSRGSVTACPDGTKRSRPIAAGETFEAGGTTWLVRAAATPKSRPAPVRGRRSFNRPPRSLPPERQELIDSPVPPEEPTARARMGWAMLAGPVLVGVIMAFFFRPIMAVIALVGPVMMAMSWVEDRVRLRRSRRDNASIWAAALDAFENDLGAAAAGESGRMSLRHPGLAEVVRIPIELRTVLWERRPHHPDYLRVSIGLGRSLWDPPVRHSQGDPNLDVAAILARHALLPVGPVEVDLSAGSVVGVCGDRPAAVAMVRAVLLRLAVHHGPADIRVAVITDSVPDWDWCGWLPHARVDALSGRYRLGADPNDVESVVASLSQAGDENLIVVADAGGLDPAIRTRLAALAEARLVSAVVIERSAEDLPGACRAVVSVAGVSGELRRLNDASRPIHFAIDGVQPDVAAVAARHLYGLDDPEEASAGARLPARVTLGALVGRGSGIEDVPSGWSSPPGGLIATLGLTENGPLTVDLVADGPHGLIAGTTGSGKSEFLRSLIGALAARYGPDRVTFALVDYKGGSAFDSCIGLPHVVGLVTDLDRQLGRRALRSIEAELRRREEILRAVGADDIDGYTALVTGQPLARLVVVIDEFAALVADVPEFVPSLADISQRGRSLGVHLILATQRPAGVVGEAIRANTNLRVALRVQSAADSRDVIDDPIAAQLPRRFPGRGFLRLGPGELVPFQAARSSAVAGPADGSTPQARPVRFGWEPVPPEPDTGPSSGQCDLEKLADVASAAVARLGWSPPRPVWAPPLADAVDLGEGHAGDRRVIGMIDEPDRQRIGALIWNPAEGGLLAFGIEGSGASDAVIATAFASGLVATPDRLHIYGLDGGGGALGEMEAWPHVGAVVRIGDRERAIRMIRRLRDQLEERRRGFEQELEVLVVVDRLEAVLGAFDGPGDMAIREALSRVIVDGPTFGLFPLLSAARPGAVPSSLVSSVAQRLCFRLADPFEYAAVGLTPREVPDLGRGRGFDTAGRLIQIGRPSAEGVSRLVGARPLVNPPPPIAVLPDRVPVEAVSPLARVVDDGRFVPIGIGDRDLLPVGLRLHAGDHALIAGPARSGRTTTLVSIAHTAAAGDPTLEVIALARPGSVLAEAAGVCCSSVDELIEVLGDQSDVALVLIDDAERVDHPGLNTLLGRHQGRVHVIAAGKADALRGLYQHWTRDLRRCRLGVSLRPQPEVDGELWQTQFPRRGPIFHQPGRGYLVSGGEFEVVQVAAS